MISWTIQLLLHNSLHYNHEYFQRCFPYFIILAINAAIDDFDEPMAVLIIFPIVREFSSEGL